MICTASTVSDTRWKSSQRRWPKRQSRQCSKDWPLRNHDRYRDPRGSVRQIGEVVSYQPQCQPRPHNAAKDVKGTVKEKARRAKSGKAKSQKPQSSHAIRLSEARRKAKIPRQRRNNPRGPADNDLLRRIQ